MLLEYMQNVMWPISKTNPEIDTDSHLLISVWKHCYSAQKNMYIWKKIIIGSLDSCNMRHAYVSKPESF